MLASLSVSTTNAIIAHYCDVTYYDSSLLTLGGITHDGFLSDLQVWKLLDCL